MITASQVRAMHPWLSRGHYRILLKALQERGTLQGPIPPQEWFDAAPQPPQKRPKRRKYWWDYPRDEMTVAYGQARREHAFLLRCEGLTLQEIGDRIGTTKECARQSINRVGRKMAKALHKTRWTFHGGDAH